MCFEKNRKSWNLQEETLLKQLYESLGPKSWKKIAKQFKKHGFRRKEIEIRQKWINHIDPHISNSDWHQQELQTLYKTFDTIGSKWCLITKYIPGRTQVKIKNKFYSNLRVFIRFIAVYFEGKNCKNKQLINRIPPNILNQIYNGQKRFQFFENEFRKLLLQMSFQIDKKILEERIEDNLLLYKNFHEQLNEVFFEITENEEFKNILENDESYYSEIDSPKSKGMKTRTKIGSNVAFRPINSYQESSPIVKQEQGAQLRKFEPETLHQDHSWTTVITLQPKINQMEHVYYYHVYLPWQLVKIQ